MKTPQFSPPLVLKDEHFEPPDHKVYYLLSSAGLFLVKDFGVYRACTKVETGLPSLKSHREEFQLKLPKIPRALFERVVAFLQLIYLLYRSEALVFLYYHPDKDAYKVLVPEQEVVSKDGNNGAAARYHLYYTGMPTPGGFIRVGTIHSHCDMPAFYSMTDEHDSEFDDSLNIVVGNLDRDSVSLYACFMVNGRKFELEPREVLEGFHRPRFPVLRHWVDKVTVR